MTADESSGRKECGATRARHILLSGGGGLILGIAATAAAVSLLMPGMMIEVEESRLPFDETVSRLKQAVVERGWILAGTRDMQKSLSRHGSSFARRVTLVEICHPEHAASVLTTDRELATLMPCALAVWEGDDGRTYVSRMNTALMGRMFGGNVAKVMAGRVAPDEAAMLSGIAR